MSEPKRPLKVFLCHAHADRDPVRGLYARLTQDGVDAWFDKAKLLPGQDWELEIRKAVREADVVVVCLSKQFNQAGFRQKEVRLALDTAMEKPEGEIFIIPARLEECETLESLRKWHWVDLFEEVGYEMLMRALRARANKIYATLQINSDVRENKQLEVVKKTERERIAKEAGEKQERDVVERDLREKFQREVDKRVKDIQHQLKRELFFMNFRSKLNKFSRYFRYYIFPAILMFSAIVGVLYLGKPLLDNISSPTKNATGEQSFASQPRLTATETFVSAETLTPSSISSETTTVATSLPTEITDAKGVPMVLVPAGIFTMGSYNGEYNEQPPHQVTLNEYYMDVYEVSNVSYKACVTDAVCSVPKSNEAYFRHNYYDNSEYYNYPVVNVDWRQAQDYCGWRGGRLPTEAEWEKAARGGLESKRYPWGDEAPDCTRANFWPGIETGEVGTKSCVEDTSRIGSYPPNGFGLYDMAGNVWEWVADWYDVYPGGDLQASDGFGQKYRVYRGGSWYFGEDSLRVSIRFARDSSKSDFYLGFRCVRDINP